MCLRARAPGPECAIKNIRHVTSTRYLQFNRALQCRIYSSWLCRAGNTNESDGGRGFQRPGKPLKLGGLTECGRVAFTGARVSCACVRVWGRGGWRCCGWWSTVAAGPDSVGTVCTRVPKAQRTASLFCMCCIGSSTLACRLQAGVNEISGWTHRWADSKHMPLDPFWPASS